MMVGQRRVGAGFKQLSYLKQHIHTHVFSIFNQHAAIDYIILTLTTRLLQPISRAIQPQERH